MKTACHQDGDSFDIAHADIRRSTAGGKRLISLKTIPGGEQIAGLRVKIYTNGSDVRFPEPFFLELHNLNGTESIFSFTGRTEIEASRVHEIELWRSRRVHYRHAAGHG